jgi:threonyl-tRNA synthetase
MAAPGSQDLPTRSLGEAQAVATAESAKAAPKTESEKPKKPATETSDSLPDFIVERNKLFEELWQEHLEELKNRPRSEINVTIDVGDGNPSTIIAKAWESTPASFLKDVPKEFSANVVIAKIDGKELWDLNRPLERDCKVTYLPFDSPEGREVFWHSSAHCLGEACEHEFQCLLSHGPPTAQGFFYDMAIPGGYVTFPPYTIIINSLPMPAVLLRNQIGHLWIRKRLRSLRSDRALTGWK